MQERPECHPSGTGLRNYEIEGLAGLGLQLARQNGYLSYSILHALVDDGKVELLSGTRSHPTTYRLKVLAAD